MLTLAEAKEKHCCRICEKPIPATASCAGWMEAFGSMIYPIRITLNFGEEFAHTDCLPKKEDDHAPPN